MEVLFTKLNKQNTETYNNTKKSDYNPVNLIIILLQDFQKCNLKANASEMDIRLTISPIQFGIKIEQNEIQHINSDNQQARIMVQPKKDAFNTVLMKILLWRQMCKTQDYIFITTEKEKKSNENRSKNKTKKDKISSKNTNEFEYEQKTDNSENDLESDNYSTASESSQAEEESHSQSDTSMASENQESEDSSQSLSQCFESASTEEDDTDSDVNDQSESLVKGKKWWDCKNEIIVKENDTKYNVEEVTKIWADPDLQVKTTNPKEKVWKSYHVPFFLAIINNTKHSHQYILNFVFKKLQNGIQKHLECNLKLKELINKDDVKIKKQHWKKKVIIARIPVQATWRKFAVAIFQYLIKQKKIFKKSRIGQKLYFKLGWDQQDLLFDRKLYRLAVKNDKKMKKWMKDIPMHENIKKSTKDASDRVEKNKKGRKRKRSPNNNNNDNSSYSKPPSKKKRKKDRKSDKKHKKRSNTSKKSSKNNKQLRQAKKRRNSSNKASQNQDFGEGA